MVVDYTAYADQCEYFDEPSSETKLNAQRVIASFANDVEDAVDLLMMCGVHPQQLKLEEWLNAEEAWRKRKKGQKITTKSSSGVSLSKFT